MQKHKYVLVLLGWVFFFLTGYCQDLQKKPSDLAALIVQNGLLLTGQPYVAGTLEHEGPEKLRYYTDKFDCVTFIEYVLALSLYQFQDGNSKTKSFEQILTNLRYSNGKIDGYGSRIHYFSQWIHQQQSLGVLLDMTKELGGLSYKKTIDFVSKNMNKYPKLQDKDVLQKIKNAEVLTSSLPKYYIPKQLLRDVSNRIKSGDIIAITTTIKGLDVVHTGIAIVEKNNVYLLHASEKEKKVVRSEETLAQYLTKNKQQSGVIIVRCK